MTYLNYLEQVVDTPAVNYHEYILSRKRQEGSSEYRFFELEAVQQTWAKLSQLETELYKKERIVGDDKVLVGTLSPDMDLLSDENSLAFLCSRIKTLKDKYALLKQEHGFSINGGQVQKLKNNETSISDELLTDSDVLSPVVNFDDDISGVDFLLSMAGIFSSEERETKKLDREDIANAILRRNGME